MDLGPGGINNPGPSGFGGGYNATTTPSPDTGGGGDNQPIVARPTYVVPNTVPDNDYFTPSRTGYGLARAANFFLNPVAVTKYAADKALRDEYEEELKTAQNIINARLGGDQFFGAPNRASMQSYKNTVGGFPDPFGNTGGGGDNVIPRVPVIAQVPTDIEGTPSDFDLYAALEGRESMRFGENPFNYTGVMQRFAEGGVARQAYGLGGLLRKATKAVKKVLKSDIGKAALLYGAGTYLGGLQAFGGSGLGAGQKFGFKNFGGRLLNPTGKDGIANLLNPFRSQGKNYKGLRLPWVQTAEEKAAETAAKEAILNKKSSDLTVKELLEINKMKNETPDYVKYGIPLAMLATYGVAKKEKPDDLDQEIAQNYTDNSGLKQLYASLPEFRFEVQKPYRLNVATGGRIGYSEGGDDTEWRKIYNKYKAKQIALGQEFVDFEEFVDQHRVNEAKGGRIGYEDAGMVNPDELSMSKEGSPMFTDTETGEEVGYPYNEEMSSAPNIDAELYQMYLDAIGSGQIPRATTFDQYKELMSDRMGAKEGGLMDLGGMEKDYRAEGGFVPIGKAEKADDVPARLSKNEFVFTADAVRNAGGGDIDKGAEVMYNVMKNLESGGKMSDESQGLKGARDMFQTSQRLGEIL